MPGVWSQFFLIIITNRDLHLTQTEPELVEKAQIVFSSEICDYRIDAMLNSSPRLF